MHNSTLLLFQGDSAGLQANINVIKTETHEQGKRNQGSSPQTAQSTQAKPQSQTEAMSVDQAERKTTKQTLQQQQAHTDPNQPTTTQEVSKSEILSDLRLDFPGTRWCDRLREGVCAEDRRNNGESTGTALALKCKMLSTYSCCLRVQAARPASQHKLLSQMEADKQMLVALDTQKWRENLLTIDRSGDFLLVVGGG